MKKAAAIIVIVLLTIITSFVLVLYNYFGSFSSKTGQNNGSQIQPKEAKAGEPINVLLLGVDIGTVGSTASPQRSDTMVVFHYDPATAVVSMVSVPRDTKVTIKGNTQKINAANAFGGTELAISSVENLLDIDINYYVEINYKGFREVVDALGGIDTVIPFNMSYDDNLQNLHIHFKKGQNVHLDGEKAEEFVRWRKNNDGTGYADGDLGRIKTQQDFMMSIIDKFKSASLSQKKDVIDVLPEYISTNMGPGTMMSMALAELPKINISSIQKFTLQGDVKTIDGLSYFVYNAGKNQDILALLGSSSSSGYSKADNSDIKVQILNGSGIEGAAEKARTDLEEKGYTVLSTGDITGVKLASSYIIDKTLKGSYASQMANDCDIGKIEKDQDTLSKVDCILIIGNDKNNYF